MSRLGLKLQRAAGVSMAAVPRLYLTPSTGTYANSSTVTLTIREDSQAVTVNAIQANLTYPASRLDFVSINTSGSPFTTTVENTGSNGDVRIAVALLGSSVTGDNFVATITFNAVTTGAAAITFAAGSGIASAADSVDICQLKQGGSYTIN